MREERKMYIQFTDDQKRQANEVSIVERLEDPVTK